MNQSSNIRMLPLLPIGCIGFICVLLIACGIVNPFISCYSVDSAGQVYIGTSKGIRVYDSNVFVRTISAQTSRGYVFTILDDDTLLLSTSTIVYKLNLHGNIMDSYEDKAASVYNEIQRNTGTTLQKNGDSYSVESVWGWTSIIRNKTDVVYRIDGLSFFIKLLLYLFICCLVGTVCFFAFKTTTK